MAALSSHRLIRSDAARASLYSTPRRVSPRSALLSYRAGPMGGQELLEQLEPEEDEQEEAEEQPDPEEDEQPEPDEPEQPEPDEHPEPVEQAEAEQLEPEEPQPEPAPAQEEPEPPPSAAAHHTSGPNGTAASDEPES